jgi:hypothetical protein
MGGGNSSSYGLKKSQREVIELMMPVYFDNNTITDEECVMAANCWDMILNEKSVHFTEVLRQRPDFKYTTW